MDSDSAQTEDDSTADAPETLMLEAGENDGGKRIDVYISKRSGRRSRVLVQRCIREGKALLNGEQCRPSDRLKPGDRLTIEWPVERVPTVEAEDIPLDILHEDDEIIVINKQPDLVVHPNDNFHDGTLVNALVHHDPVTFKRLVDANLRPGIVHRLDKDTSGALVIAKNLRSRKALKTAFKERDVEKTYLAIVIGEFGSVTGRIVNQIGRHPVHRTKMAVVEEGGKHAITNYRVLGSNGELSLMQIRIETGRTHQIRVHFANLRHPVIGDAVYGGRQKGLSVEAPRQMLHAWKLVFPHPVTGIKREYMAPPPEDFRRILEETGLPMISGPRECPLLNMVCPMGDWDDDEEDGGMME